MSKIQPVRGTYDILPQEFLKFDNIINIAKKYADLYSYQQMSTPIFEFSHIFKRSLGEASDIVNKEMYNLTTKSGEEITLRPEFTASVVRSIISNGLAQNMPLKLFSYGPLFRYERPQKGRQRQFHQINFERFGEEHIYSDAETVKMAQDILLQITDKENLDLHINSLSNNAVRNEYIANLKDCYHKYYDDLSQDSKFRLEKNPLRILDSKDKKDQEISVEAPLISDFYDDETRKKFDDLLDMLHKFLQVNIIVNQNMVRGLDYYNDTIFEFIQNNSEASNNTILAGGRYDGLCQQMGGANIPAIGFAAGVERLILASQANFKAKLKLDVAIFTKADSQIKLLQIADKLRANDISCNIIYSGKYDKKFKKAAAMNAKLAVIAEDDNIIIKNITKLVPPIISSIDNVADDVNKYLA